MTVKRIHIVDDEPHILRITRLALERAGYEVIESGNGQQALDSLEAITPDVLITDIDMPKMSGDDLCREIEKRWPHRDFLIIVVTARAEVEHRDWAGRLSGLRFFEKPISLRHLVADLHTYFAESDHSRAAS